MSAPTSTARKAAVVSVLMYGLPVPDANIITRPFSKWRMARRRMYGSATALISMAVWARVAIFRCSSASWSASELMTVASIPA